MFLKHCFFLARTAFDTNGNHVKDLEDWIDEYDEQLPKLTQFILPVSFSISKIIFVLEG